MNLQEVKEWYAKIPEWAAKDKIKELIDLIEEKQEMILKLQQQADLIYGRCPRCNAAVVLRERRINGYDTCLNGHTFPSRETL